MVLPSKIPSRARESDWAARRCPNRLVLATPSSWNGPPCEIALRRRCRRWSSRFHSSVSSAHQPLKLVGETRCVSSVRNWRPSWVCTETLRQLRQRVKTLLRIDGKAAFHKGHDDGPVCLHAVAVLLRRQRLGAVDSCMHRSGQLALDRHSDPRGAQVVANVGLPGRSDPARDNFQCPDVQEQRSEGCPRAGLLPPPHPLSPGPENRA